MPTHQRKHVLQNSEADQLSGPDHYGTPTCDTSAGKQHRKTSRQAKPTRQTTPISRTTLNTIPALHGMSSRQTSTGRRSLVGHHGSKCGNPPREIKTERQVSVFWFAVVIYHANRFCSVAISIDRAGLPVSFIALVCDTAHVDQRPPLPP